MSAPNSSAAHNFADRVLRNRFGREDDVAVYAAARGRWLERLTWRQLAEQVADCRNSLLRLGVAPGDRVLAQLPTGTAALVAFLSVASVAGVWDPVATDGDVPARRIEPMGRRPKLVIVADGHLRDGQVYARDATVVVDVGTRNRIRTVVVPIVDPDTYVPGAIEWGRLFAEPGVLDVTAVAPQHPLCAVTQSDDVREVVTHGDAATAALHSLSGAASVRHDSIVTLAAPVGSWSWLRLLGVLSLGVSIALGETGDIAWIGRSGGIAAGGVVVIEAFVDPLGRAAS
jgi:acetoacetyl-CoA synthetase